MKRTLSQNFQEQLICFFDQHPPQSFSNSLRHLLLEYMQMRVKTGFHPEFDDFLWAMGDLFQLLDTATAEWQESQKEMGKKQD